VVGNIFKQELQLATGVAWEEWVAKLQRTIDARWSHEQIKLHIAEEYQAAEPWDEWLAVMYGHLLGRIPTGVTKDAGVQIGVRRTLAAEKERVWDFLLSPDGLRLWIGEGTDFRAEAGCHYVSSGGASGRVTVAEPYHKLRMTWQLPTWDSPSRLQLTVLASGAGKTTVAVHQEMLDDVYMRERMRLHWDGLLERLKEALA